MARLSKHLCPSMLAEELQKLQHKAEIYITHLKPGEGDETMREIAECVRDLNPKMLQIGQVFEF